MVLGDKGRPDAMCRSSKWILRTPVETKPPTLTADASRLPALFVALRTPGLRSSGLGGRLDTQTWHPYADQVP